MAARISCGVGFPKWNPQSKFTSDEENSTFQGIFMPMERTVYTYSNLVKILILTKGVDFFDTLKRGLEVPPFPMPLPLPTAPCALQSVSYTHLTLPTT